MVIDKKLVAAQGRVIHTPGITNKDVEPAIVIDIHHHHTCAELELISKSCFGRNIFKLEIAFIKVKFIAALVGRKKDIGQSIIIDITDRHAAAIIKITVVKNIDGIVVLYMIDKIDPCISQ